MPYLHCTDCGIRAFKNWDAGDTDDEDDYYCRQCGQDTQWITEAEFADRRKHRRPGERRNSEEYRVQMKQFEEEQAKKLADQQRRSQDQRRAMEEQQRRGTAWGSPRSMSPAASSNSTPRPPTCPHPTPRDDSTVGEDDDMRSRNSSHSAFPGVLEHSPRANQQRQSSTASVPTSPSGFTPDQLVEMLLREVPTLGNYVRRMRQDLATARKDRSNAVDQVLDWQHREEEAQIQRQAAVQEVKTLTAQNALLQEQVEDVQAQIVVLKLQLEACGAMPLVVEPHAPIIIAMHPSDDDEPAHANGPSSRKPLDPTVESDAAEDPVEDSADSQPSDGGGDALSPT